MRIIRWIAPLLIIAAVLVTACVAPAAPAAPAAASDTASTGAAAASAAAAGPSAEPVELRIMWWGVEQRHERTLKVIELFEAKYPNIKISAEYMAQSGYMDKVNTQLAAGNAPDIIQLGGDLSDYARRGALLALDSFVGNPINLADLPEGFLLPAKFDGTLYGVPLATNGIALIVNADMIKRAGMELPPTTWTWADVIPYGQQLQAALGKDTLLIADRAGTVDYFDYFLRQSGKSLVKDGALNFTQQDAADWFAMWKSWSDAGISPNAETAAAFNELDVNNSVVPAGKAAMTLNWVNQLPNFDNAMEDEVVLFPLPGGGEGKQSGFWLHPAQFWVTPSTSQHPYEAALFMDFTINDPEATQVLGVDRGFPGSQKVLANLTEVSEPVVQKMLAYFSEFIANAGPKSQAIPNGSEFAAAFLTAWQAVGFGQKTVDEAAADVVAAAEAALNK